MSDVPAFRNAMNAIRSVRPEELEDYLPGRGFLVVEPCGAAGGGQEFEPGSELPGLLPPEEVLRWASESHQPVGLNGSAFRQIKRFAADRGTSGLVLRYGEERLIAYRYTNLAEAGTPRR